MTYYSEQILENMIKEYYLLSISKSKIYEIIRNVFSFSFIAWCTPESRI